MNAITSLKLQSFNNNRARRNKDKRLIKLQLWTAGGPSLYATITAISAASIAGMIGTGLGFGAGLFVAGIRGIWEQKTGISSSQAVQPGRTSGYPIASPAGAGIHYSNGGNGQHHYYYYFPPPYYYYYG
ncbi:hypothetical protein DINM_006085 [Dirofilaria immitis]|nr:hypothetical protein [Dirofilaria immitis]